MPDRAATDSLNEVLTPEVLATSHTVSAPTHPIVMRRHGRAGTGHQAPLDAGADDRISPYHEFRCLRRLSAGDRVLPFPLAEKLGLAATSVQPVFYGARRFTYDGACVERNAGRELIGEQSANMFLRAG